MEFTFNDGPHNCEAIGVDPLTQDIWLVEKIYFDSNLNRSPGIYVLNYPGHAVGPQVAVRVGNFPVRNVTGMAFSPDGKRLIIRNYFNAHLYQRRGNISWRETLIRDKPTAIPLPLQRQGEAICFTADSKAVIVTSESKKQPIWQIDIDVYLSKLTRRKSEATKGNTNSAPPNQASNKTPTDKS